MSDATAASPASASCASNSAPPRNKCHAGAFDYQMKRLRTILLTIISLLTLAASPAATARNFNDKTLNRPYADNRRWHLGFSVGMHVQDAVFTNNGIVSENGRRWFVDQPGYSPGFCVNGLIAFRLNDYFSVRFNPGMYFGNRDLKFRDALSGDVESQNLKSAYVVMPVDLKFAAMRWRNARPYLTGGIMPAVDVAKKRSDYLKFNSFDTYLTIGLGCDFYLPYFKLLTEVKFCFGLTDLLQRDRPDLEDEPDKLAITRSLEKVKSRMVVLTFYFE